MIVQLIEFLKARPKAVQTAAIIALAVLLVWSVAGVDTSHAHTWMEQYIPGFWALFTLLACLVLVFFSRWFGKSGIMTREDYYDD